MERGRVNIVVVVHSFMSIRIIISISVDIRNSASLGFGTGRNMIAAAVVVGC